MQNSTAWEAGKQKICQFCFKECEDNFKLQVHHLNECTKLEAVSKLIDEQLVSNALSKKKKPKIPPKKTTADAEETTTANEEPTTTESFDVPENRTHETVLEHGVQTFEKQWHCEIVESQ